MNWHLRGGAPIARSESGLIASDLEIPFGEEPGLCGICVTVDPGERVAVVGRSGAGKTTLLRALAGLAPVRAGSVAIGGRDVTRLPPERRGAAYLHQTPVLFPHLSVGENVAFPMRVRQWKDAAVRARVEALLAAVGLSGFEPRAPSTLSGGQRHRVALARAIAAEPELLLLDEPLFALDPALRQEVRSALLSIQAAYAPAMLLVTHDLDEAALLADRIAVLLDGSLAQMAPPAELFRRPTSLRVARFLGIPNEVPGRVTSDAWFESVLGMLPLPAGAPLACDAVAFFQADAVSVSPAGDVGSARAGWRTPRGEAVLDPAMGTDDSTRWECGRPLGDARSEPAPGEGGSSGGYRRASTPRPTGRRPHRARGRMLAGEGRLCPTAGTGQVLEVRHRLHSTTMVVRLNGIVIEAQVGESGSLETSLQAGSTVCVQIDPQKLILLPVEASASLPTRLLSG